MRVLVGTLFSGENEFEECKRSLRNQSFTNFDHVVFKNLPNKEAHETLYNKFMDEAENYDLFVKLDADMVFMNDQSLSKIVGTFQDFEELDHAILGVKDWASDSIIDGLHIFSNRATWSKNEEDLFVDPSPKVPGRKLYTHDAPAPLVLHSPDPSRKQAFRFGFHRALKLLQTNKEDFSFLSSKMQFELLANIWQQYSQKRDAVRGIILFGADYVIRNELQQNLYSNDQEKLYEVFENEYPGEEKIFNYLKRNWESRFTRYSIYPNKVGYQRIIKSLLKEVPRKIVQQIYMFISPKYI